MLHRLIILVATLVALTASAFGQSINTVMPSTATIGTPITIAGSAFGTKKPTVTLTSPGSTKKYTLKVTSFTDTQIEAVVAAGIEGTFDVTVKCGNVSATDAAALTLAAPQISSISPGTVAVGATVTINGSLFGAKTGKVLVNGKAAKTASWSDSTITFALPATVPNGGALVAVSNAVGTNTSSDVLDVTGSSAPSGLGANKVECSINGKAFKAKLVLGTKVGNVYNFLGSTTGSKSQAVGFLFSLSAVPHVFNGQGEIVPSSMTYVENANNATYNSSNMGSSYTIVVNAQDGDKVGGVFTATLTAPGKPVRTLSSGSFVFKPQSF